MTSKWTSCCLGRDFLACVLQGTSIPRSRAKLPGLMAALKTTAAEV